MKKYKQDENYTNYYYKNKDAVNILENWKKANEEDKKAIERFLVDKLVYLVKSKIKRFKGLPFYDDLFQEGKMAIVKSIHEFDIEKGPNFFKIAEWYILSSLRNYLNWYNRTNWKIPTKELRNRFYYVKHFDLEELQQNKEYIDIITKLLEDLPSIHKDVIIMRFGLFGTLPKTLQQIGNEFQLSRQRVDQIKNKALSKLQKEFLKYTKENELI